MDEFVYIIVIVKIEASKGKYSILQSISTKYVILKPLGEDNSSLSAI